MSSGKCPFHFLSRRSFFKSAGTGLGLLVAAPQLKNMMPGGTASAEEMRDQLPDKIPFFGEHQAGILTPQQNHTYFIAFDVTSEKRRDVVNLLKAWTEAAERMTEGQTSAPMQKDLTKPGTDSGDVLELAASRLTLTFGFGPGLFSSKNGKDRFGLARHKPKPLADLPKFHGDQLVEEQSGGDLSIQACADDPQVAFHAIRQLARLATDIAQIRWAQSGFLSVPKDGATPRNLLGFKDGTQQPLDYDSFVWTNHDSPGWMRGGSYLVVRKIRMTLEHWDRTEVDFQEEVIGRHKLSGAPIGKNHEREPLELKRMDASGNPVIAENAHVRLANAASNGGAQILRRGYSYNDGVNFVAERWPPWRQGMEHNAGLFFLAYQSDPRSGFTKIFQNMAKLDALNQFVTHISSGLFACPPGAKKGEYIGQRLFEA